MTIKTLTLCAIAVAASAFAANAGEVEQAFSAKLTNVYATRPDGSEYSMKDEACKEQFGRLVDKTITGMYKIDAEKNAGGGELTFDDQKMMLTPVKVGDVWAFYTTNMADKLVNENIEKINVTPTMGSAEARAEVVTKPFPDEFVCVVATHGRDQ